MKFLKADYLGETNQMKMEIKEKGQSMNKKLVELTDKEERLKRELEKIRLLDAELAKKTKMQRDLKNSQLLRKHEEERKAEV